MTKYYYMAPFFPRTTLKVGVQLWISLSPKMHFSYPHENGFGQLPILFSLKCVGILAHGYFNT